MSRRSNNHIVVPALARAITARLTGWHLRRRQIHKRRHAGLHKIAPENLGRAGAGVSIAHVHPRVAVAQTRYRKGGALRIRNDWRRENLCPCRSRITGTPNAAAGIARRSEIGRVDYVMIRRIESHVEHATERCLRISSVTRRRTACAAVPNETECVTAIGRFEQTEWWPRCRRIRCRATGR